MPAEIYAIKSSESPPNKELVIVDRGDLFFDFDYKGQSNLHRAVLENNYKEVERLINVAKKIGREQELVTVLVPTNDDHELEELAIQIKKLPAEPSFSTLSQEQIMHLSKFYKEAYRLTGESAIDLALESTVTSGARSSFVVNNFPLNSSDAVSKFKIILLLLENGADIERITREDANKPLTTDQSRTSTRKPFRESFLIKLASISFKESTEEQGIKLSQLQDQIFRIAIERGVFDEKDSEFISTSSTIPNRESFLQKLSTIREDLEHQSPKSKQRSGSFIKISTPRILALRRLTAKGAKASEGRESMPDISLNEQYSTEDLTATKTTPKSKYGRINEEQNSSDTPSTKPKSQKSGFLSASFNLFNCCKSKTYSTQSGAAEMRSLAEDASKGSVVGLF